MQYSRSSRLALVSLTLAFFTWGFLACLSNSIVMPALKVLFNLNYATAMQVQLCFFGAYGLMSLPMAKFLHRFGYQVALGYGFILAGVGCALLWPASLANRYGIFLIGFFVLASGNVLLEVASNPCATLIGEPNKASGRLTFLQGFNSLGTSVAPIFGAWFIFGEPSLQAIAKPYLVIAIILVLWGVWTLKIPFPDLKVSYPGAQHEIEPNRASLWHYPHLVLGGIAIFLYVGAEVGVGSLLINFMALPNIVQFSPHKAANYVAYYWIGMMLGRFLGAYLLRILQAPLVLLIHAGLAILLIIITLNSHGYVAMWTLLAVGLCNSIMFPVIFSLAIRGLGARTAVASGFLCVSIIGGALMPLLQGIVADHYGVGQSFVMPLFSYVFVAYYAIFGCGVNSSPIPH